jgi:Lrp/AsnC family leucine-responsive transcriptional regulator
VGGWEKALIVTEDNPSRSRLDGIDIKILEALQADGKITYRDLSARVALSASACVARVKQLEKLGIIQGYHASVAVERVRPTLLVMAELVMRKHAIAELDRFDRFLHTRPEVIEIMRVQGPSDYMLKLMMSDMREWRTFAHRLLSPENGVERMVSHLVIEEPKSFTGYPLRPSR